MKKNYQHIIKHGKKQVWDKGLIKAIAAKYTTRQEFAIRNHSAYNAARCLCILDDVCSHMETLKQSSTGKNY